MKGFIIAAPQSGSGKTTVTLALMAALRRRGLEVAPFKCGPDFIDTGYHRLVSGVSSINLDSWICPESFIRETFAFHSKKSDISIIEGVMGLFDGLGASFDGSTAEIAKIVGAPVVLVINARGMAASAAAVVKGFSSFDSDIEIAGVIFNNVGSLNQENILRDAIRSFMPDVPLLGFFPRANDLSIPSRHLGLLTAEENPLSESFIEKLAEMAEKHIDLDFLAEIAVAQIFNHDMEEPETSSAAKFRVAVARDAAFCFVYEDNLRIMREAGAEITEFSPLADDSLPEDIDCIYLPGGYPEIHAEKLASNAGMIRSLKAAVNSGLAVYAECGGFVYLTRGIDPGEGRPFSGLVDIFPVTARMLARKKALGYRQIGLMPKTFNGTLLRGHEFHYSETEEMPPDVERLFRLIRNGEELGLEGYRIMNCVGTYQHIHLGSDRKAASRFLRLLSGGVS